MAAMINALGLNPRPAASYLEVLGESDCVSGTYDSSAATFRQSLKIKLDDVRSRESIAAALAQAGEIENASHMLPSTSTKQTRLAPCGEMPAAGDRAAAYQLASTVETDPRRTCTAHF